MKEKLTLSVDPKVIRGAKSRAREKGISLSAVVEKSLKEFAEPRSGSSFVDKWLGRLSVPERQPEDPRLNHILDKLDRAKDRD